MSEWIYFIHAPRENFAATMTDEERRVWAGHAALLRRRLEDGSLILAGPTLGPVNTGICVFEAPDEDAARRYMAEDPTIASGIARGELRPFRAAFIRPAQRD
ncbi:YciI family protein [Georgenia ruanii]|uniref:YCII-related domain-containing protein n=1 Tax=Georgenia ruanii TaxID=348442 RepID=A0A7J9UY46_9MICO|nr:YciI family protein [Georgenia ruanii]MPV89546.1 hypothetical protein [Georgenia ruanii]